MFNFMLKTRVIHFKQTLCCEAMAVQRQLRGGGLHFPGASCLVPGIVTRTSRSNAKEVGLEQVISSHFVQAVGSAPKRVIQSESQSNLGIEVYSCHVPRWGH